MNACWAVCGSLDGRGRGPPPLCTTACPPSDQALGFASGLFASAPPFSFHSPHLLFFSSSPSPSPLCFCFPSPLLSPLFCAVSARLDRGGPSSAEPPASLFSGLRLGLVGPFSPFLLGPPPPLWMVGCIQIKGASAKQTKLAQNKAQGPQLIWSF